MCVILKPRIDYIVGPTLLSDLASFVFLDKKINYNSKTSNFI